MRVELREHSGRNIATRKPVVFEQYRVFVDDRPVGFIGWHQTAKLLLTARMGPLEERLVCAEIGKLMNRDVESKQAPEPPLREPAIDDHPDDFDP